MKVATSSASFARPLADGTLTQLEWLDLCANELELDGVVFDAAHFPRTDDEYLAQLKKTCADLGLTVAALATEAFASSDAGDGAFATALALGAPLIVASPPRSDEDPSSWGRFTDRARETAAAAKRHNVTLAVRNAAGTLCPAIADLRRLGKDVDSAWLRFALDPLAAGAGDPAATLEKTAIASTALDAIGSFAGDADDRAPTLIRALARFRGFVVLDSADAAAPRDAYHAAVARFTALRATALDQPATG